MVSLKEEFIAFVQERYKFKGEMFVRYFREASKCDFCDDNITDMNLTKLKKYLLGCKSPGTARTYCAIFKSFFKTYGYSCSWLPKNYEKILSLPKDEPETTYLDEDDIRKFLSYKPKTDAEYYTQRLFYICLMTGCRKSDGKLITASRIRDNKFTYVAKKTGKKSSEMYVDDNVIEVLNDPRYKRLQKKGFSDVTYNATVRSICMKVGIDEEMTLYQAGKYVTKPKYEFFASHSARRSAATNMYNRDASSLLNISKMLGHTSISQTQRYIRCSTEDTDAMKDFKSSFKLK